MKKEHVCTISHLLSKEFDLLNHYFNSASIYIFGSQIDNNHQNSDLDLLIVSQSFHGVGSLKRIDLAKKLLQNPHFKIDPLCLTPTELERFKSSPSQFSKTVSKKLTKIFPMGCQYEK